MYLCILFLWSCFFSQSLSLSLHACLPSSEYVTLSRLHCAHFLCRLSLALSLSLLSLSSLSFAICLYLSFPLSSACTPNIYPPCLWSPPFFSRSLSLSRPPSHSSHCPITPCLNLSPCLVLSRFPSLSACRTRSLSLSLTHARSLLCLLPLSLVLLVSP